MLQEHDNASTADQAAKWEEQRQVSRYAANLPQLEAGLGRHGRQIPSDPSLWVCDETGVKENLWLNLSTGFIGSGRQVCITPVCCSLCCGCGLECVHQTSASGAISVLNISIRCQLLGYLI